MAPPSTETITAGLTALRSDAQTWRDAGFALRASAASAGGLDLGVHHFSAAGDRAGLTECYAMLQHTVAMLLAAASTECRTVGAALTLAAAGYEDDERNAVHRLRQTW